jgi:hypothetical protein
MRKYFLLLSGLVFLIAGSAFAENSKTTKSAYGVSVTGKRHRKNLRHLLLAGNLEVDKKKVYECMGYTPHRLRFNAAGKKTERWRYYAEGLEFIFDEDSNLIKWRRIKREDRRNWIR